MRDNEPWDPKTTIFLRKAQDWLAQLKYVAVRLSPGQAAKVDLTSLVNVALLKAWRCRKECTATSQVEARRWVVQIYVNLIHDQLRRKYTKMEVEAADTLADKPDPAGSSLNPVNVVSRKETGKLIQEALAKLPERDRALLTLHYIEGTPMPVIAELFGMNVDAVKKAAQRARNALKQLLAGENQGSLIAGTDDE